MIRSYLKITFRSLWKNKVFVLINIVGMGLAIACCIIGYLNYDFNVNFDSNQTAKDVYRINGERIYQNQQQVYGMSPIPLGLAVRENIGDVDDVMRYMPRGGDFKLGDDLFHEKFIYTDRNFFDFFYFDIVEGDKTALRDKSNILISRTIAEKYFPEGDPIGQTLTHFHDTGNADYTVAAVFEDQPLNSSFADVKIITDIENLFDMENKENEEKNGETDYENDWSKWAAIFVKVSTPNRVSVVEKRLTDECIDIQNRSRLDFKLERYLLEPFEGMAHRAANDEVWSHWLRSSMPPPAVFVPGIMSILILLIACFNFTNTSMAISGRRLKEIGLRKVMGGLQTQLIVQFMLENTILCFLSLLAGLLFAFFLVPAYSNLWPFLEITLDFTQNASFYAFLAGVLVFTGLVAGSYPAFFISRFEPVGILKGSVKFGDTGPVTGILLTLQFSISLVAVILSAVFYRNAVYQKEMDYGFNKDAAISLYFTDIDDYRAYKNHIDNGTDIVLTGGSEHQIHRSYRNDPVVNGAKQYDVDILHIGDDFFETMDFKLREGRNFRKGSKTDMDEAVIVSEEMVKVFGWEKPLGQKLVWMDTVSLYVAGIMQDAYINGLFEPMNPLMLRYVPEEKYQFLTVKTAKEKLIATNEYLKTAWKELFPDKVYSGYYLDKELSEAVLVNTNVLKMFGFLGIEAMFMSIIGLFSIVSLSVIKRTKEVGVRKVLGASIRHLMFMLNKNFIAILLIAAAIGSMVSYMIADPFMDLIWEYHSDPDLFTFVFSVLLLLIVPLFVISIKVYRAAVANPTDTIRTE